MDLKDIVSVGGVSGLNKIIGRSKTGLILETMDDQKKRFASGIQDKVSVLEDISMFTLDGDLPLAEVLFKLNEKGDVPSSKEDPKKLRAFLVETINLDSDRVYDSDIRKLVGWFHLLKNDIDFSKLMDKPAEDLESDDLEKSEANAEEKSKTKIPSQSKSAKVVKAKNSVSKANTKGVGGSKTTYRPKSV